MALFLAFLIVPLIEIGLFIQVGGLIGLWPTLAVVVLTAVVGTWLVRREGLAALAQVQQRMRSMTDPTEPLAHGALILFAGALLLTPGFFTDTCGLLLLIPAVRATVIRQIAARILQRRGASPFRPGPRGPADPQILDGEFFEIDTPPQPPQKPSDWTRR